MTSTIRSLYAATRNASTIAALLVLVSILGTPPARCDAPPIRGTFPDALSWDGRIAVNMELLAPNGEVTSDTDVLSGARIVVRPYLLAPHHFTTVDGVIRQKSLPRDQWTSVVAANDQPLSLNTDLVKSAINIQMAIAMDPTRDHSLGNPRPCSLKGASFLNGECYQAILYAPFSPGANAVPRHIYAARLNIDVEAFGASGTRLETPNIVRAKLLTDFLPLKTKRGSPVLNNELSATADGRLLFSKRVQFNLEPGTLPFEKWIQGWSDPIDLYRLHEATRGVTFNGQPFEATYPLAERPIRNHLGQPCNLELCPAAYPWISQDGSELFINQTLDDSESSARRASFTVFGKRTRHQMVVVDSEHNRNRLPGPGRTQALGIFPGMWAPHEAYTVADAVLPRTPYRPTYVVHARAGGVGIAPFDLHETTDDNYLIYLRMNESVRRRASAQDTDELVTVARSGRTNKRIDDDLTPDTSGNFNNAALRGGAAFPHEVSAQGLQLGEPFSGKSIFFPAPGYLEVPVRPTGNINPAGTDSLQTELKVGTWQFAIKPLKLPTQPVAIAAKGTWRILLLPSGEIVFAGTMEAADGARTPFRVATGAVLSEMNEWYHIALLLRRPGSVDSILQTRFSTKSSTQRYEVDLPDGAIPGSIEALKIGPSAIAPIPAGGQGFLYQLDEFAISRVARTRDEVKLASRTVATDYSESLEWGDRLADPEGAPTDFVLGWNTLPAELKSRVAAGGHDVNAIRVPTSMAYQLLFKDPSGQQFASYVALGRQLFHDDQLTGKGISCATCHHPQHAFVDPSAGSPNPPPTSRGLAGSLSRNTPTILNRLFMDRRQFFDGRSGNLMVQAWVPIVNPDEMGGSVEQVVRYIRSAPGYQAPLAAAGDENPAQASDEQLERRIAMALAAFELTLVSPPSVADFALSSNESSPDPQHQASLLRGRAVFFGKGRCAECHLGSEFTDGEFHNTGTAQVGVSRCGTPEDKGRFAVTRQVEDLGAFKTPTLRSVSQTKPYFHNGCTSSLEGVVRFYNRGTGEVNNQGRPDHLGKREIGPLKLSDEEMSDLVTFLEAL